MCVRFFRRAGRRPVVGSNFPRWKAQTVEDKVRQLPNDVQGKYTLWVWRTPEKSEDELNTWFVPVFNKFIQKATGLLAGMGYDVNVYFVPMFTASMPQPTGNRQKEGDQKRRSPTPPYILFYNRRIGSRIKKRSILNGGYPYFFPRPQRKNPVCDVRCIFGKENGRSGVGMIS